MLAYPLRYPCRCRRACHCAGWPPPALVVKLVPALAPALSLVLALVLAQELALVLVLA